MQVENDVQIRSRPRRRQSPDQCPESTIALAFVLLFFVFPFFIYSHRRRPTRQPPPMQAIEVPIQEALIEAVNTPVGPFGRMVLATLETGGVALAPCHDACGTTAPWDSYVNGIRAEVMAGTRSTGVGLDGQPFTTILSCPIGTRFIEGLEYVLQAAIRGCCPLLSSSRRRPRCAVVVSPPPSQTERQPLRTLPHRHVRL